MKIAALLPTHQHITDKKKRNRINVKNYFGLKIIVNEIKLNIPNQFSLYNSLISV